MFPQRWPFLLGKHGGGKVMTMERLKRRGFSLVSRRSLCGEAEENLENLLIHYPNVWGLWAALAALLASLGADWMLPFSGRDLILGWKGFLVRKRERKIWMAAPSCLFWTL